MVSQPDAIRLAPDMGSWLLFPGKTPEQNIYLVGSRQIDKYLTVPANRHPLIMKILEKLEQGETPEQIEIDLHASGVDTNVRDFCKMLAQKNLIEWAYPEAAAPAEEKKEPGLLERLFNHLRGSIRGATWQVFSTDLGKFSPFMARYATPILSIIVIAAAISSGIVWAQGGVDRTALNLMAGQILGSQGLFWMSIVNLLLLPFFILMHETTHCLAAARGGVYPRRFSMNMYLYITPYFSIQLPGLYTLPNTPRYIAIAAGPIMDLLLGNLFLIAARSFGGPAMPWLILIALTNYSRLLFNILPILPMTDGSALLSQALFHDIDIRAHAAREFNRWYHKQSNQFRGRYLAFFLFNVGIVAALIGELFYEVNNWLIQTLVQSGYLAAGPLPIWVIAGMILIDGLALYLVRGRLRVIIGL